MSETKPADGIERRVFTIQGLETRAAEGDQPARLAGYAAVFDEMSEEMWGFREVIRSGAFAKSLGGDVRALFNHNPDLILGRTTAKTLTLREDSRGLYVEILPPDTGFARDLMASIARGDIDQMSFGFRTVKDSWKDENGKVTRELLEVDVFDVSPVTFPAYPTTEIALRSLDAFKASIAPPVPDYSDELRRLDLADAE
jgi:HK97 family phage prohead protease